MPPCRARSNADVLAFLRLVSNSSARFALLSTFRTPEGFANSDIGCASGDYRAQDLERPPFGLPPPIAFYSERYPADARIGLGLWALPFGGPSAVSAWSQPLIDGF